MSPNSTAAILLREFDSTSQAIRYAEGKMIACTNPAMAEDYRQAWRDLCALEETARPHLSRLPG